MSQEKVEQLNYIQLKETEFDYEIMIQFDGGGVLGKISKKDDSHIIAGKLRYLANLIDNSVAERAAT